jgi:hypothetical protein
MQNDIQKEPSQDEEKYANFFPNNAASEQNQDKTEPGNANLNPEKNSQNLKNESDLISDKEPKQEPEALDAASLPTEEAKQPENEPIPIENEINQQEMYDQFNNQTSQQNVNNFMDIEPEEVIYSQEFGINTNTTEAFTELDQNQSEINLEILSPDIPNRSPNPDIYIPIQPWDKVVDNSTFYYGFSDLVDDDDRLKFYKDYEEQYAVNG